MRLKDDGFNKVAFAQQLHSEKSTTKTCGFVPPLGRAAPIGGSIYHSAP
jgi:hypothetical protein